MATIGYRPGAIADAYAQVGTADSLNQRATISAKMTEHGWAYRRGIRGGRVTAEIPDLTLPLWSVGDGVAVEVLLGTTGVLGPGTAMLDESDGTAYTAYLLSAVMLRSGKRYAEGFVAADAPFGYGYLSTGDLPAGEVNEESRRSVPGTAQARDPFGATSVVGRGWIATWTDYEPNVSPAVPTARSPGTDAVVPALRPTFAGDFRDDNELLPGGLAGDSLGKVGLRVYEADEDGTPIGPPIWSTTRNASAGERTARRFQVLYDGPALTPGDPYVWQGRVHDQFDATSDWSSLLLFRVGGGSVVQTSASVTGKQETRTPGPFVATWTHPIGLDAVGLDVDIFDADSGSLVAHGQGTLSPPVHSGGTITKPWAQLGDIAPLRWGGRYESAMRVFDSDGSASAPSPRRAFTVNAAPSVPDIVTPLDGAVVSSRPVVLVEVVDPDDDQTTGLAVFCRVLDEDGGLLVTEPMAYDSRRTLADGTVVRRFRFALGPADLPGPGGYRVASYATDGTVYSGGNTVLGAGALSGEVAFTFVAGPTVSHVVPADGAAVATDTPVYDWETTGQVRARVEVWTADGAARVYDSEELTQTATHHTQRAGYLENGGSYYRVVSVWNASNQLGMSAPAFFTVDYADPDPVTNLLVSPHRARHDVTPTAQIVSWEPTTYDDDQFQAYVVTKRAASDAVLPIDDPTAKTAVRIAEITSPSQTSVTDYTPASRVPYVYGVKQVVEIDGETLVSAIVHAEGMVAFDETVICDARHGGARRVVLPTREERTLEKSRPRVEKQPWNGADPVVFRTKQRRKVITADYHLLPTETATVEALLAEIDAMEESGDPLCYRDGRSRRVLGEMLDPKETDPTKGGVRRITIPFLKTAAKDVPA